MDASLVSEEVAGVEVPTSLYADNVADPPEFQDSLERFPRKKFIQEVRELSVVNGWRSTALIVANWSIIIVAFWFAIHFSTWWSYVLAAVIVATRQQYLGVMIHDGAHHMLYRNRRMNNLVSDLFLAFPLGLSTDLYRGSHFQHHMHAGGELDPDLTYQKDDHDWFIWPKSRFACAWVVIKTLLGLNVGKAARPLKMWSPWFNIRLPLHGKPHYPLISRVSLVLSTIVIYALVLGSGLLLPVALIWMIPGLTLLNFVNRLRGTSEHLGVEATHELNATRTVIPTLLERLTIAPFGISYHLEHHLFPSVPGPNLPKLHRILMSDESFRKNAHLTKSYAGVFRELMQLSKSTATSV